MPPYWTLIFLLISFVVADKCPLSGSCPYYDQLKKTNPHTKCPLTDKWYYKIAHGSPYYVKHKQDHSIKEVLEDKNCPLTEKCTFYNAIKEGKPMDINWNNNNCPLAQKCPYYKTFKEHQQFHHACPVLDNCEHHTDENGKLVIDGCKKKCPHASKCPYIQKNPDQLTKCPMGTEKEKDFKPIGKCPYAKNHEKDSEQGGKCPYANQAKSGKCPFSGKSGNMNCILN